MPKAPGPTVRPHSASASRAGRTLAVLLALAGLGLAPFARAAEIPLLSTAPKDSGENLPANRVTVSAVESAVAAGLPSLAENLGAEVLGKLPSGSASARRVRIALASARIQSSAYADAEKILREIPGDGSDKSLRLGLAAYGAGAFAEAASHLRDARRTNNLSDADALWLEVLSGLLAAEDGQENAAKQYFNSAGARAASPLVADQVALLRARMLMRIRPENMDAIDEVGRIILSDLRQTFQLAKTRAFALHRAGKNTEAAAQLTRVPLADRDLLAERDLLVGLLLGGRSPEGRAALLRAMDAEGFIDIQSAAVAALREAVVGSAPGELVVNANAVFDSLTLFVGVAHPDSRIADLVHYTRALVMFTAAEAPGGVEEMRVSPREKAAQAVQELLEKFPASPLRADALALTADIALKSKAYRKAADALVKLSDSVAPSEGVGFRLIAADCYFLNKDYDNAADGYKKAGETLAQPADRGKALLGRVRSLLATGKMAEAEKAVDEAAAANIPAVARLGASWLVCDALRDSDLPGRVRASSRIRKTLDAEPALDPGMRVRFLWLRAMFELDSGNNAAAAATAVQLAGLVTSPAPGTPAEILDNAPAILAQTALLKARAQLGAGGFTNPADGFEELRGKFPDQPSAAASYLVEGRYLASKNRHEEALKVFRAGYDKFKSNPALVEYATASLYEAACEAIALGDREGRKKLQEAFDLLDTLTKNHRESLLYFRARLMQGDILRKLNEFDSALKLYETLITERPNDADRMRADLARADCLVVQGDTRPDRYAQAADQYERLINLPKRPADLAAEAAFKRADAMAKAPTKGAPDAVVGARLARNEAAKTLWRHLDELLGNPEEAAKLNSNARFWVAKSLILVSDLRTQNGDYVEARAALRRLLDYNAGLPDDSHRLPGSATARQMLEKLSGIPATPVLTQS